MNASKLSLDFIAYDVHNVFVNIINNFSIKNAWKSFTNLKIFKYSALENIIDEVRYYPKTTGIMIGNLQLAENAFLFFFILDDHIIIILETQLQEFHSFFCNECNKTQLFYMNNKCEEDIQKIISIKKNINKTLNENIKIDQINILQKIKEQIVICIITKSQIRTQIRHFNSVSNNHQNEISYKFNDFISILNLYKSVNLYFNVKDQFLYVLKYFDTKDIHFERERKFYNIHKNQNPFICKYYGYCYYSQSNFIVIEYIENKTLLNLINNEKIELIEKMRIILQIMSAVEFMHLKNFIYRDLKHDNILIDSKNNAILIDFDQAKEVDGNPMTGDIGSLKFISPEQKENEFYGFESDIYSLGNIIHFILTQNLYDEKYEVDLDKSVSNVEFQKDFFNVYKHCFEKQPKSRPNITNLFNDTFHIFFNFIKKHQSNSFLNTIFKVRKKLLKSLDGKNNTKKISELSFFAGYCYSGIGIKPLNIKKTIHYFTISANQGNSLAQFLLGSIYYQKKYCMQDFEKAIHYLTLSANQNNSSAQYYLGLIYYEGEYISRDIKKSLYYFELSSEQNNSEAQYCLGNIYYKGQYIRQDIKKSIQYLTHSSDNNNPNAQYLLGNIYFEGKYIQQDINKAIHYFSLSSDNNNSDARHLLGCIYYGGKYISQDINKAIQYFTLSANQNNAESQLMLGVLYYFSKCDLINVNKAIYYLKLSAEQGNSIAYHYLGVIYYEGKHISIDINKSIYYLTLSANSNNSNSQYLLGIIYFDGKHINQDIKKSIHYLTLSANLNNTEAQFILGEIYYLGKSISRDINKAINYFTLSSDKNKNSQYYLGEIYYEGKFILRDIN